VVAPDRSVLGAAGEVLGAAGEVLGAAGEVLGAAGEALMASSAVIGGPLGRSRRAKNALTPTANGQ
jgi:hypothetical protein